MAFIFPYIGNAIIPIDELIFFGGVGIPPSRSCPIDISHSITGGCLEDQDDGSSEELPMQLGGVLVVKNGMFGW